MKLIPFAFFIASVATGIQAAAPFSSRPRHNWNSCTNDYPNSEECDRTKCIAANDCVCFGSTPTIPVAKLPQIVYLTFDDALTNINHELFLKHLFNGQFTNPNGCIIKSTHFLTQRSTDYSLVNQYFRQGHEMGVHSITHRTKPDYWKNLDFDGWTNEMSGMRTIINKFAKIPENNITGIRVPFLQSGGDEYFRAIKELNFTYDCSWPTQAFGYNNLQNGVWPFTMDYLNDMDCQIEPCPYCSFPGIWVQPMLDLADGRNAPCAMLDACLPEKEDVDSIYKMLLDNFNQAYNGDTRAPFGLYVHVAWFFSGKHHFEGYTKFLEEILKRDDVWILPVKAGIEFRKNPMTNEKLLRGEFPFAKCDAGPQIDTCSITNNCKYKVTNEDIIDEEVYMKICGNRCPKNYPWLGNPEGH